MYLINIKTNVPYDLHKSWLQEVHDIALSYDDKYIVFSDGNTTYLLLDKLNIGIDVPSEDYNINAIHYYPTIDDITLGEFMGLDTDEDIFGHAIEDLKVGDVAEYLEKDSVILPIYDEKIKELCMFESKALPNADTSTLKSYINYILLSKDMKILYKEHMPKKHTRLELESEMMRCNKKLYIYNKYVKTEKRLNTILEESISKQEIEHEITGLLYDILCEGVVYCMGNTWCFINGIWEESASDGYIWNFITTQFINYLKGENANKIAIHIMSVTVRSRMIKDLKLRLEDNRFYMLLDSKRNLIRMANGVYNTNTMVLTEAVPSDYVSVKAGVPYEIFDGKMAGLINILKTIFPIKELLDFFILSCSTFLEGYNSCKVFYVWWGEGNNAKSLIQTLVMKTFGDYCSTAPTSLVTGKRTESSNATPELCHIEKKLVVFLQEPNPEEKIKAGMIKEMTGNDSMYVRQLFKSGKTMILKTKLVIVCNNVMEIPGADVAIKRRIIVIPFISKFYDASEYREKAEKGTLDEYSHIIDYKVENELLTYRSAFMYLLCKRFYEWKEYENMALNVPDIVRNTTREYITRNNYPLRFITNYIHSVEGNSIYINEIYECYKDWFKNSYPSKKVDDLERFKKEVQDEGYKCDNRGLISDIFISYNGET